MQSTKPLKKLYLIFFVNIWGIKKMKKIPEFGIFGA